VKKSTPIKKTVAKPAKAKAKPVTKKVKTVAKNPVAKATKPVKKPAAKPVKSTAKSAKPLKAAKPAKPLKAAKPAKAAPVKKAPVIPAKAGNAPKAKAAPKEVPVKVVKAPVVKETPAPIVKAPKVKAPGKESKKAESAKAAAAAPADAFPALDPAIKRPAKPFFLEVKPGVERVIKRGDKSAASPVLDIQARRKGPAAEESSEELAERIERELQSQSFLKRNRMRPQLCTKCGINAVSPRFTIDRELGYCDGCAEILHLGETKEARRMEFNLALKKEEGAEDADEPEGPSPEEVEDVPDDVD